MDTPAGENVDSVVKSTFPKHQQFHHHQRHLSCPASATNYDERQLLQLFSHVDQLAVPGTLPDQTCRHVLSRFVLSSGFTFVLMFFCKHYINHNQTLFP